VDGAGHLVLHYFPVRLWSALSLETYFETNGSPKRKLLEEIWGASKSRNIDIPALQAYVYGTFPCRFKVFHSLGEIVAEVFFIKKIGGCRQARMEYYRNIKTPENFLRRGSSLYKKKKLETVYKLIHAFNYGCVFSEREVDKTVSREMEFIKGSLPQADHVRVAFVELGLMQRTPDGRSYWREPDISMTHGIVFPMKIGGFQKQGFKNFEDPGLGFSVEYRHERINSICANFYIYDKGLSAPCSADLEREYENVRKDIFNLYERERFRVQTISELVVEFENASAISEYYHLTARITDEEKRINYMSYLLITVLRSKFVKIRFTSPESSGVEAGAFESFISELISLTTTPHMLHNESCMNGEFLKQANY
jgi:hypothetical protein